MGEYIEHFEISEIRRNGELAGRDSVSQPFCGSCGEVILDSLYFLLGEEDICSPCLAVATLDSAREGEKNAIEAIIEFVDDYLGDGNCESVGRFLRGHFQRETS